MDIKKKKSEGSFTSYKKSRKDRAGKGGGEEERGLAYF